MVNPEKKIINSPAPNSQLYALETSEPHQLLERFKTPEKTGVKGNDDKILPEVWGILFSNLFVSPVDLINAMHCRTHQLGEENELMLRQFIKGDCRRGGRFVQTVINKGGMIDRAALIMIADPYDLARIEHDGTTAIHRLSTICDKQIRPELIRKFGKQLLSTRYDSKGMPALLQIFGLGDLRIHDLNAIGEVFSKDELRKVRVQNGRGRNGLEIFNEISRSIKNPAMLDSGMSAAMTGEKKTMEEPDTGTQISSPVRSECVSPPPREILAGKDTEPEKLSLPDITKVSGSGMPEPKENTGKSPKIIVVEDNQILRDILEIRLKNLGYNLLYMAGNGEQALKLSQEIKADIIFMDISMPGKIDGIDTARQIKNTCAHSQIIFLSAFDDPETISRAKAVNPAGYIRKPFTDTDLLVALKLNE